jgi:hypothetical protein
VMPGDMALPVEKLHFFGWSLGEVFLSNSTHSMETGLTPALRAP